MPALGGFFPPVSGCPHTGCCQNLSLTVMLMNMTPVLMFCPVLSDYQEAIRIEGAARGSAKPRQGVFSTPALRASALFLRIFSLVRAVGIEPTRAKPEGF